MKKFCLLAALALGMSTAFVSLPAQAQVDSTTVNVTVKSSVKGSVNWEKGAKASITAIGIGLPPANSGLRGKALARRAAMVDCYRNLAEIIQGVNVDSETTMHDLTITSDVVHAQVNALVQGAEIIDEGALDDGSYYVNMSIPLYGKGKSLASIALAQIRSAGSAESFAAVTGTELTAAEVEKIKSLSYTGVIIDAGGLGLEATFSPVIYDENGRSIYGIRNIDRDFAISQGMVEYSLDLQDAAGGASRAGDNPLVLKAVAVKGGKNSVNKVNVVVSVQDGDRILLANGNTGFLESCAVVFVK